MKTIIVLFSIFLSSFSLFAGTEDPAPSNDLLSLGENQCLVQVTTDNSITTRNLKGKRKYAYLEITDKIYPLITQILQEKGYQWVPTGRRGRAFRRGRALSFRSRSGHRITSNKIDLFKGKEVQRISNNDNPSENESEVLPLSNSPMAFNLHLTWNSFSEEGDSLATQVSSLLSTQVADLPLQLSTVEIHQKTIDSYSTKASRHPSIWALEALSQLNSLAERIPTCEEAQSEASERIKIQYLWSETVAKAKSEGLKIECYKNMAIKNCVDFMEETNFIEEFKFAKEKELNRWEEDDTLVLYYGSSYSRDRGRYTCYVDTTVFRVTGNQPTGDYITTRLARCLMLVSPWTRKVPR